jgi:hypothetical protein
MRCWLPTLAEEQLRPQWLVFILVVTIVMLEAKLVYMQHLTKRVPSQTLH